MIGSLGELATMAGMPSEVTLRKMIAEHADFPIISRGKNGVSYEIDLAAAAAFVVGIRSKEEEIARSRAEEVRQLGFDLLGPDAAVREEQIGLTAAERKALLEEELAAIKVAERRGELVRKASMEEALGAALVWFAERGRSFSARLAKRVEVSREVITAIDALIAADQRELANRMGRISDRGDGAAAAGESQTDLLDTAV